MRNRKSGAFTASIAEAVASLLPPSSRGEDSVIQPSREVFAERARLGNVVPVFRDILADLDTPLSAYLKTAGDKPHAFLLESVQGGEKWGRYSFIGLDPAVRFTARGGRALLEYADGRREWLPESDPALALKRFMARFRPVESPELPRFQGGAVGYFSYDVIRRFERIPDSNPDRLDLPEMAFMVAESLIIFDNLRGKMKVVANAFLDPSQSADAVYDQAVARIQSLVDALRRPLPDPPLMCETPSPPLDEGDFVSEMTRSEYAAAVNRAKEYILAGDAFQVVLSQRLSVPFPLPPIALYRALRTTNPSPYLFLVRMGDHALVGSSPEILVRQEGETVTLRPIAGTRPRGATAEEDQALEAELLADPKERAEHLMLIDLGRNDIGRIAQTGSVRVTERFVIERYSHVMHIVSNVEGRLQPGLDSFDVVAATFPAGTLTGAPKIRAMEIIDELEVSRRGPYGGAVGYISFSGNMDLAIAIRTAILKDGRLFVQAGAGIVADSQPDKEWEETMNKARAVFRSAAMAQRGLE
ncbi:MAG: anthranilate synthase component I [Magnetococcus sp. WYHC-3]